MKRLLMIPVIVLLGAATGIGSCKPAAVKLCGEKLPVFEAQLEDALLVLYSSSPSLRGRTRMPAAVPSRLPAPASALLHEGARSERERWTNWSDEVLVTTQRYLDVAEHDPALRGLRKDLSWVASQLVFFRGFAEKADRARMARTLEQIQARTQAAYQHSCGPARGLASKK